MNSKLKDSTNRVIRNKRGFSIVGVLVAATLMGLIAIGFSTMMTNSKKAQTGVQNSIDFDIMRASVMQVLANSDLCKDAFFARNGTRRAKLNPASPPPVNQQLHSIKVGPSTVVAKNQKLGGGLEITKLEFQQVTGTAPNYQAFLYIEGKRATGGLGGEIISNHLNRPFLSITTNPRNNNIISCGLSSTSFELVHSFVTSVSDSTLRGEINLASGKRVDDYKVLHVLGICTDPYASVCNTQANSQGPAYFSVPVALLKSKPGYLFRAQTFSGDDSGAIGIYYISDTRIGWATMRRGRLGEIWGER
jgi:hypothetical protein